MLSYITWGKASALLTAIHSVKGANLVRQEFSAAYWLERSPVLSWAGMLLLHGMAGQSIRVTNPGYCSATSSSDDSFVWAPLLSYR